VVCFLQLFGPLTYQVVSTNIITYLKDLGHNVFYFYFDTLDATKIKASYAGLIASLLASIGTHPCYDPSILQGLYSRYQEGCEKVPAGTMKAVILDILAAFTADTYIILDAMDECQDQTKVTELICELFNLESKVHILVTSRHSMLDVTSSPSEIILMSLSNEDGIDDIALHTDHKMKENSRQFKGLEGQIRETLINGAHGQ